MKNRRFFDRNSEFLIPNSALTENLLYGLFPKT